MKKLFIILTVAVLAMAFMVPLASAQETTSADCSANASASLPAGLYSFNFFAGETLTFTAAGQGDFLVTAGGTTVLNQVQDGTDGTFTVSSDGVVDITVEIVNGTLDSSVSIACAPAGEDTEFDGTLCHIPPGNPNAAHTITVGSQNAVDTHVDKHGDTLGACAEGVQTRADLPGINVTIFIIFATDSIEIYGECDDECEELVSTPIVLIIDFDVVVIHFGDDDDDDGDDDDDDAGEFMYVDNPEDYGFEIGQVSSDGLTAIIYYLHPDPEDPTIGVFQINVYQDDTLLDDSILLFITTDGDIIRWTDQSYWDELTG